MIDFYCGINETKWNYHPVEPGPLACVSPVYGASVETKKENQVFVPESVEEVYEDSGAFCDGDDQERLEFAAALDRQLEHSEKYNYKHKVKGLASYDRLIDEKWENGKRFKKRWSENEAWSAVVETVQAAAFLAKHYDKPRIQSAQGVTAAQYLECAYRVLEYFDTKQDIFGLGGWCISGKMPVSIRPSFNKTMLLVLPAIAKANVKKVHIWGVIDPTFLGPLLWVCDQHELKLSTDSAGPQKRPVFGEWGYRGWKDKNYKVAPVETRGLERAKHVEATRQWLKTLRNTEFYHHPDLPDRKIKKGLEDVYIGHTLFNSNCFS